MQTTATPGPPVLNCSKYLPGKSSWCRQNLDLEIVCHADAGLSITSPRQGSGILRSTCLSVSVLLWRRCSTLCTSGFMDDVTFKLAVVGQVVQPTTSSGVATPWRSLMSPCLKKTVQNCFRQNVVKFPPIFTARAYARAVLGVVILSVCLLHAWIVTKLNDALQIFLYHTKGQSLCYSDTKSGWSAMPPSL